MLYEVITGDVAANWDVERFTFIDIIIMQTDMTHTGLG